jgi:hypothetical protein
MIKIYMDVHINMAITRGLRKRAVDVLTAQEDRADTLSDPELLDRATLLDRALFTHDVDFLIEATRRQGAGQTFAGVIFARHGAIGIGVCIDELELIAKAEDPTNLANRVTFIPLSSRGGP